MTRAVREPEDPEGRIEGRLSQHRAPYQALVAAVLAWTKPTLAPRDYEQIALLLTAHARSLATEIHHRAMQLPQGDGRRALATVVLADAAWQLSAPIAGTARCTHNRARVVRALYERLDRLTQPPAASAEGVPPTTPGRPAPSCAPEGTR
ncbi:restriction endonuclease [Streptomyces harbinensis]|uniref:restriction endonuclease n=1 Tax=Streptomyces harbinensis TaxID=1176198 RepID=UPI0034E03A8F